MVLLITTLFMVIVFNEKRVEFKKAIDIYKFYKVHNKVLKQDDYIHLTNQSEILKVKEESNNLLLDSDMIEMFALGNINILTYKKHYYIFFKEFQVVLKSQYETSSVLVYAIIFLLLVVLIVFMIMKYIQHSILPLRTLQDKIDLFGKGDLSVDTRLEGDNEVAQVGNAFYDALVSINQLQSNRTLFIRNIIHELKTPLTRNNLILYDEDEVTQTKRTKLLSNNYEIDTILDTINQFDSLNSRALILDKTMCNLIDLVEEAIDESMLEEYITLEIQSTSKQMLDFKRFILVLKNLMINAHLYSKDNKVKVMIHENKILVSNKAKEDKALELENISKAFYKNDPSTKGMGLGVYIVQNILSLHGLVLRYEYLEQSEEHSFSVVF